MNEKPEASRISLRQMIGARTAFLWKLSLPSRGVAENTSYVAYELHELTRRSKT